MAETICQCGAVTESCACGVLTVCVGTWDRARVVHGNSMTHWPARMGGCRPEPARSPTPGAQAEQPSGEETKS